MTNDPRALPKIDAHHHLWDVENNPYPWLTGPTEPRIYGDYGPIKKNYLIDDFLADSRPHNVVKSVHVQANWDPADPVGETRWCQGVADVSGFPHAIVGHANLAESDVEGVLAAHCESANMRGIRHIIGHTDHPDHPRPRPDYLNDPAWEHGFSLLREYGLSFDFQLFPRHMADAARIVRAYPATPVAICHTGFPFPRDDEGLALWRCGMRALSECPHVYAKLSGPAMVMLDWTVDSFGPFIRETIDLFGPARCMFASNVPPDLLAKSYDQIYAAFYDWAAPYSADEQRQLFHDTAATFYRI